MIDLTPVVTAIITLLLSVISAFLVPYIKSKMSAQQLATIIQWVKIAVQSAEMIYKESGMGAKKKEYVMNFLKEKGFTLNTDEVDSLIESAVLELKQTPVVELKTVE